MSKLFTDAELHLLALSDKAERWQGSSCAFHKAVRIPDSQLRVTKSGKRERISTRDVDQW